MNINKCIDMEISEFRQARKRIEEFMENAPEGVLKTSLRNNGSAYFYAKTGDGKCRYIHRDDVDSAKALATKTYYLDLLRVIERQEQELMKFAKEYDGDEKYRVYTKLSSTRRRLIKPIFATPADRIEKWQQKTSERKEAESEETAYCTENGEKLKSESEYILASLFRSYKDRLLYRYTPELKLKDPDETVTPTFELISLRTGKTYYWEHADNMSESGRIEKFINKIDHYVRNGFICGKNLIITYETDNAPLCTQTASEYIKKYLF